MKILVVDDQLPMAESHQYMLEELGYEARIETDPKKVISKIQQDPEIQTILLDIQMPEINGIELLNQIKVIKPQIAVIMASVLNDLEMAVNATKKGSFNYLLKPIRPEKLKTVLESISKCKPCKLTHDENFTSIITQSKKMREIFKRITFFVKAGVNILIEGESGTGKELTAQLIHSISHNHDQPFVSVNIAAIQENLFSSELFGHCKGAFTGANKDHVGFFESAKNGTLFLDEIGELPLEQQKKLLRVIQTNEFTRVGETKTRKFNARLLFATNKNLEKEFNKKRFRKDLYFRISAHTIYLPPVRERKGDIELLSNYFFKKYNSQYGRSINGLSREVMDLLLNYNYPGNIRELENIISCAVLTTQSPYVQMDSLPQRFLKNRNTPIKEIDPHYKKILDALARCNGNQSAAARLLGVDRSTVFRKLKEFREEKKAL